MCSTFIGTYLNRGFHNTVTYYLCVNFKPTPSFQLNRVKIHVCFACMLLLLFFKKREKSNQNQLTVAVNETSVNRLARGSD